MLMVFCVYFISKLKVEHVIVSKSTNKLYSE